MALLAGIETLRQLSARNEGLAFFQNPSGIGSVLSTTYNYVPVIFAVLYVLAWSLVDLDAKRVEPYFQLSNPNGSSAATLFIDYSYTSIWTVPFKAARRKHWIIAFVSFIFLVISIVLPPLQSGLIGLSWVGLSQGTTLYTWQELVPLRTQSQRFTGEFIDRASSVFTNRTQLPAFVSPNYAVAPFSDNALGYTPNDNRNFEETWEASVKLLWANPSCVDISYPYRLEDPTVNNSQDKTLLTWNLKDIGVPVDDDGPNSCTFSQNLTVSPGGRIEVGVSHLPLWGAFANGTADLLQNQASHSLNVSDGCGAYNHFAAYITMDTNQEGGSSSNAGNGSIRTSLDFKMRLTGFLCKADHFSSLGTVKVQISNGSVVSIDPASIKETNRIDSEVFNSAAFDTRLNTAWGAPTNDSSESSIMDVYPVRTRNSIATMVLENAEQSNDFTKAYLRNATQAAYSQAFAIAAWGTFDTSFEPSELNGKKLDVLLAATITPLFAILSEVFLGCATVICLTLVFVYRKRENFLRSDPDSLAATFSLIADCLGDFDDLKNSEREIGESSTAELKALLASATCQWRQDGLKKLDLRLDPGLYFSPGA